MPPNWYATVMGTGIVALALPENLSALRPLAAVFWLVASVMLVGLAVTWRSRPFDPAMSPFLGAPPMALLTVGSGTLAYGREVLGLEAAAAVATVLWTMGTLFGLATLVGVPWMMLARRGFRLEDVSGAWLMPVVPPMVASTAGAQLVPHDGPMRDVLVAVCYGLFGVSLLAVIPIVTLLIWRIRVHGPGPVNLVPALFIVLGPLGQSVTAVNRLSEWAPEMTVFGLAYGLPVWGLAMVWTAVAAFFLVRTARRSGMPFAMTWWAFTFPVGTCVTGASALGAQLGSEVLAWAACALYVVLVAAWATVAVRTARILPAALRELAIQPANILRTSAPSPGWAFRG